MTLITYEWSATGWIEIIHGPLHHCVSAARLAMAEGGGFVLAICAGAF